MDTSGTEDALVTTALGCCVGTATEGVVAEAPGAGARFRPTE